LVIAGVGDLVVMRPLQHLRSRPPGSLLGVLAEADFAVGNLEVPLTSVHDPQREGLELRGDPELIPDVVAAGVDAVALANNHVGDQGWEALSDLADDLQQAGLVTLGIGETAAEAFEPVIQNICGVDVAFVTATCVGFDRFWATENRPGMAGVHVATRIEPDEQRLAWEPASAPRTLTEADPADARRLLAAIRTAAETAPLVVAVMHWGVSWSDRVERYQLNLGRALVEAGASAVFGCHSHTVQGIELVGRAPVFQGLGTFVFGYRGELEPRFSRDTAVGLIRIQGSRVVEARLVLGRLDENGEPVRAHPERARLLAEGIARNSAGWGPAMRLESDTLVLPCG
jgi:poly-gamma-glutamate synthesis protein (capsule biosynthesis protein)